MQIDRVSPAPPVARSGMADTGVGTTAATTAASGKEPARLLNPQPVIDPALGIVVTEYFNQEGDLTSQYPTEKALQSYRIYGEEASAP